MYVYTHIYVITIKEEIMKEEEYLRSWKGKQMSGNDIDAVLTYEVLNKRN